MVWGGQPTRKRTSGFGVVVPRGSIFMFLPGAEKQTTGGGDTKIQGLAGRESFRIRKRTAECCLGWGGDGHLVCFTFFGGDNLGLVSRLPVSLAI